jgi:uncharacterized protein (DUF2267 family)
MTRIKWASSQIEKKAKYRKPVKAEQKEIDKNVSQLVSTVLAWAQRPLPTASASLRSNQLPLDARRLIRDIFHLTEKGLQDNEASKSSELEALLDKKAQELVNILRIDPVDLSSIREPPETEEDVEDIC